MDLKLLILDSAVDIVLKLGINLIAATVKSVSIGIKLITSKFKTIKKIIIERIDVITRVSKNNFGSETSIEFIKSGFSDSFKSLL